MLEVPIPETDRMIDMKELEIAEIIETGWNEGRRLEMTKAVEEMGEMQ